MSCSKPLPVLPQMPWNVKKLIAASANSLTKVSLLQCSKEFKSLVDKSMFTYSKLFIRLYDNYVEIHFELEYSHSQKITFPEISNPHNSEPRRLYHNQPLVTVDSIRDAVDYFGKVLKQKNISVKRLGIKMERCVSVSSKRLFMESITEAVESCGHKLKVGTLHVRFDGDENVFSRILPHLEPGTLKTLVFESDDGYSFRITHIPLESIVQTEQWKQAEWLYLVGFSTSIPNADMAHFRWITDDVRYLTLENLKKTVERAVQNPNRVTIRLEFHCSQKEAIEAYRKEIGFKITIPGTDMCVTISFRMWSVTIERKEKIRRKNRKHKA